MNTTEVKTQLHNYIEKADQAFLRIAYVMFQQYFEEQKNQQNREQELLTKIIQGLSPEGKSRLDALNAKRKTNTISTEEHTELLQLVEKVEAFTANRVLYLSELAQLRNTDIRSLMKDLKLQKTSHA